MIAADALFFGSAGQDWRAVSLIHVPFDESVKWNDSTHVVFTGLLASPDAWGNFQVEWEGLLRTRNIAYFKAADAFNCGGAWQQFAQAEDQRDALVMALAECGLRHAVQASASAITTEAFRALPEKARASYKNDPFYVAFESNIQSLLKSRFAGPSDQFTLICDDSEEYSEESLKSFRRFVRTNPRLSSQVSGICFLDDKRYPPLQLADLFAYCHRRHATKAPDGLWAKVYARFFEVFSDIEPGWSVRNA